MVRLIAHNKYGGKKHKILFRDRDYHGTTLAALRCFYLSISPPSSPPVCLLQVRSSLYAVTG